MEHWYTIQTKPRQEKQAEENLHRQGYHCYYPRIKQLRKFRGKRRFVIEAFFPNYVFLQLDLYQTNIAPIRSTRGVTKIVQFGNQMHPVPDTIIMALKKRSGEENIINPETPEYKKGQVVNIEEGPLAGLTAIFQATCGKDRAILLLSMLGKQQEVRMPLAMIE